jgi:hypothetical protein
VTCDGYGKGYRKKSKKEESSVLSSFPPPTSLFITPRLCDENAVDVDNYIDATRLLHLDRTLLSKYLNQASRSLTWKV